MNIDKTLNRELDFEYELYSKDNVFKKMLYNIESSQVDYGSLTRLKYSARITMTEDSEIDYLNDMVKIICVINGEKTPIGLFLLSSPKRKIGDVEVIRDCECYSKLKILDDDKTESRYTVLAGTNAVNEVKRIIGNSYPYFIPDSNLTTSTDKDWEIGTPKLDIINELLSVINYNSLTVDNNGVFVSSPYVLPTDREIQITYEDNEYSIINPDLEEDIDLYDIPNVIVRYTNSAEINPPLVAIYENNNPSSPTSTVNRGRKIVSAEEVSDVADLQTLQLITKKNAYEMNDKYSYVEFKTAINPVHGYLTCIQLKAYDINNKYIETEWSMDCQTGGEMQHKARRIINI